MATVNNLGNIANEVLSTATLTETGETGIKEFTTDGGFKVFTSETDNIDLSTGSSDNAILSGSQNIDATGNENENFIAGNNGDNTIDAGASNDQVSTGDGNDTVLLGAGDDIVEIDGTGTKIIDGGEGNDLFILGSNAAGSQSTFTGLNVGDKVRVTVADTNGDGQLNVDDIDGISADTAGNVVFTLKDGTSFTLEGVNEASATNGDIAYDIVDNSDGTFDVILKAASDNT